jgi:hypothetical protein
VHRFTTSIMSSSQHSIWRNSSSRQQCTCKATSCASFPCFGSPSLPVRHQPRPQLYGQQDVNGGCRLREMGSCCVRPSRQRSFTAPIDAIPMLSSNDFRSARDRILHTGFDASHTQHDNAKFASRMYRTNIPLSPAPLCPAGFVLGICVFGLVSSTHLTPPSLLYMPHNANTSLTLVWCFSCMRLTS